MRGAPVGLLPRLPAITLVVALSVLTVGACSEEDAGADTSKIGAELLGSRSDASAGVPPTRADRPARGGDPGTRARETVEGGEGGSEADENPSFDDLGIADLGFDQGAEDAAIRVVEFSDFACGYCRKFHLEVWPTLAEEFVETGKVQWKYVPMVLGMFGPNAEEAAHAAECAQAQDRFPAVRERLFEDQRRWKRADEPVARLRELVADEGVELERWNRCMADRERAQRVRSGTRISRRLGVRGTPTFFVVGYGTIPGAIPLELFQQVLDSVHAEATR